MFQLSYSINNQTSNFLTNETIVITFHVKIDYIVFEKSSLSRDE
jgi:hypothetical protein